VTGIGVWPSNFGRRIIEDEDESARRFLQPEWEKTAAPVVEK
jgi:hypothetical protein